MLDFHALHDAKVAKYHSAEWERCGIVTFTVGGVEAAAVKARPRPRAHQLITSSRSSTLLDMDARGLTALVRASVHYYNTEAEVDRLVRAVAAMR